MSVVQASVAVGQSEVRAFEIDVYNASEVRIPTLTDELPSSTVAAPFFGVQLGSVVQSAPLAAYGMHTWHTSVFVVGVGLGLGVAVVDGCAVYLQLSDWAPPSVERVNKGNVDLPSQVQNASGSSGGSGPMYLHDGVGPAAFVGVGVICAANSAGQAWSSV